MRFRLLIAILLLWSHLLRAESACDLVDPKFNEKIYGGLRSRQGSFAVVETVAKTFSSPKDLPEMPGKLPSLGITKGRYVLSKSLPASFFPEAVIQPRDKMKVDENMVVDFGDVVNAKAFEVSATEITVTDILPLSTVHSGSSSLLRVVKDREGRALVAKTLFRDERMLDEREREKDYQAILSKEIIAAKILSDLGIGPTFRGIFKDKYGWNVLTDYVSGDFAEAYSNKIVNEKTLMQLEEMINRIDQVKIRIGGKTYNPGIGGDFQVFINDRSQPFVIDAGSAFGSVYKTNEKSGNKDSARFGLVLFADESTQQKYLDYLDRKDPESAKMVRKMLAAEKPK